MMFAAAMAALAVVSVAGVLFDGRVLVGAPIWMKPLKFSLSLALYATALAWMVSLLPRWRRTATWAGTVVALAGATEMVIIVGQVVRGRRSHFNVATPFDAAVWQTMAGTIAVLWLATMVIAVALLFTPIAERANAWAIRSGIALSLVGMGLGLLMTQPTEAQEQDLDAGIGQLSGAHSVGVTDGGPGLPVLGWSTTGGDLRIPHFVGLHALQMIPLLALLLGIAARRTALGSRLLTSGRRLGLVLLGAVTYAGLMALVTWQALRGQPLIHPDAATGLAAAALLAVAVAGTLAILLVPTRRHALVRQ